jgi:hypothetical protein
MDMTVVPEIRRRLQMEDSAPGKGACHRVTAENRQASNGTIEN